MKTTETTVESLLKQIRLTEPSAHLDQAILDLVSNEIVEPPNLPSKLEDHRRFGWLALASTAVAALIVGLLLGQFVSIFPAPQFVLGSRAAEMSGPWNSDSNRSRNIIPVKFNLDAFKLMHGHSQREEFVNCAACHTPAEQLEEAFAGWYYGDDRFFQTHAFNGVANCSACHVFLDTHQPAHGRSESGSSEHPDLHEFVPDFPDSECSNCHNVSPG